MENALEKQKAEYLTALTRQALTRLGFRKKIHIRLEDELHRKLRTFVAEKGTTIQDFLTDLLQKALPSTSAPSAPQAPATPDK